MARTWMQPTRKTLVTHPGSESQPDQSNSGDRKITHKVSLEYQLHWTNIFDLYGFFGLIVIITSSHCFRVEKHKKVAKTSSFTAYRVKKQKPNRNNMMDFGRMKRVSDCFLLKIPCVSSASTLVPFCFGMLWFVELNLMFVLEVGVSSVSTELITAITDVRVDMYSK